MINYADKIKEYRERKFLTQADLAELLNVWFLVLHVGKMANMSQQ